jgi:DNA invertase Pin-like site-specific DNA recombinase
MAKRSTTEEPAAAVLYLRLSKDHRSSDLSLKSQESKLRERASAEGLTVREVYSEGAGRSAYADKSARRPVWDRLVSEVSSGQVVMAVETSRFSRSTEDGLRQIRRIRGAGGHVLTLDGNDTRMEASALPLTVRLAVAEEESRLKAERNRRARARLREHGRWGGGIAPYGYVIHEGRLRQDPGAAPVVRRIVGEVLDGRSLVTIARGLNLDAIRTPGRAASWSQSTLSAILKNPALCGWLRQGRGGLHALQDDGSPVVVVEGAPIATPEERAKVLAALESRTREDAFGGPRRGAGRSPKALLSNILRCGVCGGPMRPAGASYYCHDRKSGGDCPGMTALVQSVDEAVASAVLGHLAALDPDDPEDLERLAAVADRWVVTREAPADDAARSAAAEMAEVGARLGDLEDARYLRGEFTDSAALQRYDRLHATLTTRLEGLRAALALTGPAPGPDLGPLLDLAMSREAWDATPLPIRQDLIRSALQAVTVAKAPVIGGRFDRHRLGSYVWSGPHE